MALQRKKISTIKNIIMQDWSDKTILIVEDVENNFELIDAILKRTHVSILWAKNGKDALKIVDTNDHIDLILMDIKLPDINGLEVTKTLRKKNSQIPIIAQTAYALTGDRENALLAGCNEYIPKPIAKARLIYTLNEYLSDQ